MSDDVIRLGQFLKYSGLASTGGEAREWIQAGLVKVEGEVETRRGRQLTDGLRVEVELPDGTTEEAVVGEDIDVPW
ncbi:RNA-binding S4 domain-containing protein [Aestuariimicrobium sp. p3-SID1156]|uniref:RNA-binding S4 domain-containing protein n=1 Tax=Aestuariimicrobium sp. p3-SID1156 TaxID=2916038 RepID=UPI00223B044D|nr:RNA-binding S4 domain-containing protein [Aestuariimicrobium sp. p3-SID1156]